MFGLSRFFHTITVLALALPGAGCLYPTGEVDRNEDLETDEIAWKDTDESSAAMYAGPGVAVGSSYGPTCMGGYLITAPGFGWGATPFDGYVANPFFGYGVLTGPGYGYGPPPLGPGFGFGPPLGPGFGYGPGFGHGGFGGFGVPFGPVIGQSAYAYSEAQVEGAGFGTPFGGGYGVRASQVEARGYQAGVGIGLGVPGPFAGPVPFGPGVAPVGVAPVGVAPVGAPIGPYGGPPPIAGYGPPGVGGFGPYGYGVPPFLPGYPGPGYACAGFGLHGPGPLPY